MIRQKSVTVTSRLGWQQDMIHDCEAKTQKDTAIERSCYACDISMHQPPKVVRDLTLETLLVRSF